MISLQNDPVKTALSRLGLCTDELRLPLCAMGEANKQRLFAAMDAYGGISA